MKTPLLLTCLTLTFGSLIARGAVPERTFTTADIENDAWASPPQRAEKLARIGEALLLPQSLDFAREVFEKAVALDATNLRANFYLHAFGPLWTVKGVLARMRPVIEATGKTEFIRTTDRDRTNAWPYFSDGAPDIKTDAQLRDLLGQLGESWGRARAFFANQAIPLEIHTAWINQRFPERIEESEMVWRYDQGGWLREPTAG